MIYIGVTKKMKDKFKLVTKEVDNSEYIRLNSWHANIFTFQRKTGAIFMNDLTRYSVVLFGLKRSDFENIEELMKIQLKKNMKSHRFDDLAIHKFTRELDEVSFINTSNRSILGQIKDSLFSMTFFIYSDDLLTEELIQEVNDRINDTPMSALEKEGFKPFPVYALKEALEGKK